MNMLACAVPRHNPDYLQRLIALLLLLLAATWLVVVPGRAETGALGIEMSGITASEAATLGLDGPTGAKVTKSLVGSPASKAGLIAGDVILSVDGSEIASPSAMRALEQAHAAGGRMKLRILRGGRLKSLTVVIPSKRQAGDGAPRPQPVIDTGGHSAVINDVIFTRDGRYIVSVADDKSIRIWDWQARKLVQVIRGEAVAGSDGKMFAMALSADQRWLAIGGWLKEKGVSGHHIRIYDFRRRKLSRLLRGHSNVVLDLAFSPDGRMLASSQGGTDAHSIVWDLKTGKVRHRLKGHTDRIYSIRFTPDSSRVVTGSDDATVRVWRADDGGQVHVLRGHRKDIDRALAISPDGATIASGDATGEIRLWDTKTGRLLHAFEGTKTGIGAMVFSPDGRRLLTACGQHCRGKFGATVFDLRSYQKVSSYSNHDNIILGADISPNGRWAATAGGDDRPVHVWELESGRPAITRDGKPIILRGTGSAVWASGITADGGTIAWGITWKSHTSKAQNPLEHRLRLANASRGLGTPEPTVPGQTFVRAVTQRGGLKLQHRRGGRYNKNAMLDIIRDGKVIATLQRGSTNGYQHRTYSLTPDDQWVISGGSNGNLEAYSIAEIERAAAKQPSRILEGSNMTAVAKSYVGHEGDLWAVTPSLDGRLLVSGAGDQTVRIWNLKTQELIITLFHGRDGEWAAFTPQGFYTGSPIGAERLLWQVNRGADKDPDIISAASVRRLFLRPDIIDDAIRLASAKAAIRASRGTDFAINDLVSRPTPRLAILSPRPNAVISGGRTLVEIEAPRTPDPIKRIQVKVNGALIEERLASRDEVADGTFLLDVPLAAGANVITVVASNDTGESEPARVSVIHQGDGALNRRGTLYIIAIGADDYDQKRAPGLRDLRFAGNDARQFTEAAAAALKSRHARVETHLLANVAGAEAPTATNIRNALSRVRNLANVTDTVMLFIAGHGVNDRADYLFLPSNASQEGRGWAGSTVLPWVEIERMLYSTLGRRILFVDTCHSAGAYNKKLDVEAYANDVTAFVATGPDEYAVEFPQLRQGVFTYAIVRGLSDEAGAADKNGDRVIRVDELGAFISERTRALVDRFQPNYEKVMGVPRPRPRVYRNPGAPNHLLADVR